MLIEAWVLLFPILFQYQYVIKNQFANKYLWCNIYYVYYTWRKHMDNIDYQTESSFE